MNRTFIIAEAGVNHNGSLKLAKKLVDEASKAGADAVKFQTFKTNQVLTKYAEKADYQKENTDKVENQYQMVKKLELNNKEHQELIEYCKTKNILFLSSPFDLDSIDLLSKLGLKIFKIPSGEINNVPYLRKIGQLGMKVILSTGMATMGEIEFALKILRDEGTTDITVLHCNTEYPTPMEDVNLTAMNTIKNGFKVEVGYSDHTLGIEIPVAAVSLGAKIIEKHFTLDKNMDGPDHQSSLEPFEFRSMVMAVRNIEKALGDGVKRPSKSEVKNIKIARKSIVANTKINKGERFTEDNLDIKRPGDGISPVFWDTLIGKKAKRDFYKDELIEL
ncbi:N-acetylneuraminate synthase [Oceanobacillus senegalensis]|uniref:N-acetylneuraminate synthase n=1 Tax=Oceanobacillus senegalensis TaxID=1936063 RepID=UPI000A309C1C|nr:N-acetylneuraminate synthase [Oceanobacillus senegalensis]